MRIWGITGTNGKTTTTWIAARFMRAAYITTVEVDTLKRRFYTGYTTPPLAQLKTIFAEMEESGAQDCVMEVSSHAIHQRRTGDTVFAGGAFLNLSEDHLDYHKTMEEYFRVKLSFAERLPEGSPYVVALDGENCAAMYEAVRKLPLKIVPVTASRPQYDLSELKLAGDYNRTNVLVAAALAECAGVPHETIQAEIPLLEPRWGRLEEIKCSSPARVFVDFAHTPDGLRKVLTAARGFCPGRLWVVFGAGGDRDPMKRPLMGAACAELADETVVTSDNPRSEDPESIISQVVSGMNGRVTHRDADRKAAILWTLAHARAGDVVIVAGKGHETTQEIAGIKHPFDDRIIIAQA